MTQIAYVVAFLLFDREAGRVRPATITGLAVIVLAAIAHVWLGESWMEQAGFPAAPQSSSASSTYEADRSCPETRWFGLRGGPCRDR